MPAALSLYEKSLRYLGVDDKELVNLMEEYCPRFGVDTEERVACFIGQLWVESRLKVVEESFNYEKLPLLRLFKGRITADQAKEYCRSAKQQANQEALANIIYGGEWGRKNLGNGSEGDGYRFRGRGYIQVTGRANYAKLESYLKWGLVDNPDLLMEKGNALIAALIFWHMSNRLKTSLNDLADVMDVRRISLVVNGGLHGMDERVKVSRGLYEYLGGALK